MKRWLCSACLCVASLAQAETWQFALIGDVPYSRHERRELPRMLEAIAESNAAFVAHIGDIKHGQARCDDEVFLDRRQLFDASRLPFVFVPGDNEWSDCNRLSNGAYDPLERLPTCAPCSGNGPTRSDAGPSRSSASLVPIRNTRVSAWARSCS